MKFDFSTALGPVAQHFERVLDAIGLVKTRRDLSAFSNAKNLQTQLSRRHTKRLLRTSCVIRYLLVRGSLRMKLVGGSSGGGGCSESMLVSASLQT